MFTRNGDCYRKDRFYFETDQELEEFKESVKPKIESK